MEQAFWLSLLARQSSPVELIRDVLSEYVNTKKKYRSNTARIHNKA